MRTCRLTSLKKEAANEKTVANVVVEKRDPRKTRRRSRVLDEDFIGETMENWCKSASIAFSIEKKTNMGSHLPSRQRKTKEAR